PANTCHLVRQGDGGFVAHLRYTCVVCALTSASGCAPPGGTSTSSSAGQQEDPPMEPAGALAVRTRGGCSYKVTTPGGRAYRALRRPVGASFAGGGVSGCSARALRLRCVRAYVGERVCPREGRAPARPRGSRRARTSSQQVCDAVRTRGGCSCRITTSGRRVHGSRRVPSYSSRRRSSGIGGSGIGPGRCPLP